MYSTKIQSSFVMRAFIKGRVNLNIAGSQTYNELCQINRSSAVSKTIVFSQHNTFKDGFSGLKDGLCPGQPKTVDTNANIAAVAGLIKQDTRLTVKSIAHSVGIS